MKVFLSALDALALNVVEKIYEKNSYEFKYNLLSYFYYRKNKPTGDFVIKNSEQILIDSGAHSFQKGKVVDWETYTREYAKWIEENDKDHILGYFEMDIDPAGHSLELVESLRYILLESSDKIIPVWHKGRGIEDFKAMCTKPIHKDRIIGITGFSNQDIRDEDYIKFIKFAHSHGCKVHCLGMTREKILDKVPFDFVDSSSWKQNAIFGKFDTLKLPKGMKLRGDTMTEVMAGNYAAGIKMQKKYEMRWWRYFNEQKNK